MNKLSNIMTGVNQLDITDMIRLTMTESFPKQLIHQPDRQFKSVVAAVSYIDFHLAVPPSRWLRFAIQLRS